MKDLCPVTRKSFLKNTTCSTTAHRSASFKSYKYHDLEHRIARQPVPKRKFPNRFNHRIWGSASWCRPQRKRRLSWLSFIFSSMSAVKTQVTRQKRIPFINQTRKCIFRIKDTAKESFVYLVHIDETDIPTQMYCQYALSRRGKRVKTRISGKRPPRIRLIAAHVKALCLPRTPAAERWKLQR